jgi:hypothetical protein
MQQELFVIILILTHNESKLPSVDSVNVRPDLGLLYFLLAKSTHIVEAYKVGQKIVVCVLFFKYKTTKSKNPCSNVVITC